MNVLIAGGFWSIAKFMVLLCCTVILIIKSLYFYVNTVKKWKKITQIFYIMMVGSFLLSLIIGLCGVVGLIRNYWDAGSLSMLIFSQVSGGIFVKELLKNDYIYLSKKELEKYKFLGKGFFLTGIVLLLMFLIIYS
ncbi:hypothetical protein [Dialister invisus]|uniref:hypothetical protein n=1 Tax=Dialister invisus TaxID=218538 RepID=UPI0032BFBBCF